MDQVEPLLYLVQALRVELDLFEIIAQAVDEVRHALQQDLGLVRHFVLGRVDLGQGRKGLHHLSHQVGRGGRVRRSFLEDSQRLLGIAGERFGIRQAITFLAQLFILARFEARRFDLLRLVGEYVHAALGIGLGFAQVVQLAAQV